jgi:hypothetical protein
MACKYLIQEVPSYSAPFSRRIDSIIHDVWSDGSDVLRSYERFLEHQQYILNVSKGCEEAIFNDPRVKYPGKDILSGPTGTMSSILTNGYLYLYNSLLDRVPSLRVNADVDLRILFFLILHTKRNEDGSLQMPELEKEYLRDIVQKLYRRRTFTLGTPIFTPEWYEEMTAAIRELIGLFETYPYRRPGERPILEYLVTYLKSQKETHAKIQDWQRKAFIPSFDADWNYRLWETHPPYATQWLQWSHAFIEDYLAAIPLFKSLFPPTPVTLGGKRRYRKTKRAKRKQRKQTRKS